MAKILDLFISSWMAANSNICNSAVAWIKKNETDFKLKAGDKDNCNVESLEMCIADKNYDWGNAFLSIVLENEDCGLYAKYALTFLPTIASENPFYAEAVREANTSAILAEDNNDPKEAARVYRKVIRANILMSIGNIEEIKIQILNYGLGLLKNKDK